MTDTATPQATQPSPLVGKFFHTTRTCPHGHREAVWQGHIIATPATDVLLIELFEWVMGEPSGQELITLTDFMARNPVLYPDGEDMRFSYEHGAMSYHCNPEDTP